MAKAPDVRKIRVRLEGDDTDVLAVDQLLRQLPQLSDNTVQIGEASKPYLNRRDPGVRRYVDVYLIGPGIAAGGPVAPTSSIKPSAVGNSAATTTSGTEQIIPLEID